MFPFWDLVVAPVLEAADAHRLVEIGALRGENTVKMLDRLGPGTELHVIDPVPEFDPDEHERRWAGQYFFHRDLSLNVIGDLGAMDAALIDGDHNWYTVYHELKALTEASRAAGAPTPLMILHDVLWPYGRRDLYDAPEQIPEEFRQPYAQRGMNPGVTRLVKRGGLNHQLDNALDEGGPRNGVMTALEDWIAEHDRPIRLVVLPIYFGLAIAVEQERLDRQPALAALLDQLEGGEGRQTLLELSEEIRLRAALFTQNMLANRDRQVSSLQGHYLGILKAALLDEHYLENEVRINVLMRHMASASTPSPLALRDPVQLLRPDYDKLLAARRAGRLRSDDDEMSSYFPWTAMGRVRLDHLERCLDTVRTERVPGDLVECGTDRGGGAIFLRGYLRAHDWSGPTVWVVDSFRATTPDFVAPAPGQTADYAGGTPGLPELRADLNTVRQGFDRFELLDERVRFVQGEPADTLGDAPIEQIALLRLAGDLGAGVADALDHLYPRLAPGGVVIIDSYADPACGPAVDQFRARVGSTEPLDRIDWAAVSWRKAEPAPDPAPAAEPSTPPATGARGAPLVPRLPADAVDLSVVVVFYDMAREAARTLHSLSRAYQQGLEDISYEVIAVDNGSSADQRLDPDFVAGFGPEFRVVHLDDQARPSPVFALNQGILQARGRAVAVMIDGAHVLTPGVLAMGLAGLRTYGPAVVTTQQWYVGPGQQPDLMAVGYDQEQEDELFERVNWPEDGYRLFEIGHFIGNRDWFDGVWESNCLFVPRSILEQVGAFDESFVRPGGGYANLELYERVGSTPGVAEVTILGEGSFHQVHGGTTTNLAGAEERRERISAYARDFTDLRGRPFRSPNKKIHYVGTMFDEAARTRSRRTTAAAFFERFAEDDRDGVPATAEPIPEDLQTAFTEAYWRNLGWQETSWMGTRLGKSPGDIVVYQELVSELRPDWIIELRTETGAPALFFGSLCELFDHGQVISIDDRPKSNRPEHPRVRYLTIPTHGDEARQAVDDIVGPNPNALVVLGTSGPAGRMVREFETYHHLVPVGGYVIMENTIVGGNPVWPSFGPGPGAAVRDILNRHHEFVSDPRRERYGLSFNPGGYLKRTR